MKNTWIDLTDLFIWRGNFTGIQRVTYNYASRIEKEGARFFVYSHTYNRFIEVPFSLIRKLSGEDTAELVLAKRQKIKRRLKKHFYNLPRPVGYMAEPILRFANKIFRKVAAMILDTTNVEYLLRKLPTANFAKNDTVVVLGAAWNSKHLIDKLATQKKKKQLKVVIHLNDILPIYQPHLFAEELPRLFSDYVLNALQIASHVTVISKATKYDVIRYCKEYKIKTPKISIIRLGEDVSASTLPMRPNIILPLKFILCVGTFEIRKNYALLYQVIKLAELNGIDLPPIVIAGRRGWLTEDLHYVMTHDPSTKNKIFLLDKMSDANLSWLYENCMFTVFSSVAEGWGLPIAESLQHGKFCLSSSTSSMPEIAGDMLDYFNPYDPRDCLDKIKKHSANSATLENKQRIASYSPYSWDDSYRSLKTVLEGIN